MTKINRTQRVRYALDRTVYVSSMIASQVSDLCVRLEKNVLVPAKGNDLALRGRLEELAEQYPTHFTSNGRAILGDHSTW